MDLWWWLNVLVLVQENISHIPAKKPRPLVKKVVYIYSCIRIHDGLLVHKTRLSFAPTEVSIISALEQEEVVRFSSDAIVGTCQPPMSLKTWPPKLQQHTSEPQSFQSA